MNNCIERNCDNCGNIYVANLTRLKFGRCRFCSRTCSYLFRGRNLEAEKVTVRCSSCGKEKIILASQNTRKDYYCSIRCKGNYMTTNNFKSPRLGTGKEKDIGVERFRGIYYKYKLRDKKYLSGKLDFTIEEFIAMMKDSHCVYCGDTENLGLDRVDNSLGHSRGNVVVCCNLCNMTKGNRFTFDEFRILGEKINEIKTRRKNGR
jgi:hypothetical protein